MSFSKFAITRLELSINLLARRAFACAVLVVLLSTKSFFGIDERANAVN